MKHRPASAPASATPASAVGGPEKINLLPGFAHMALLNIVLRALPPRLTCKQRALSGCAR